MRAVAQALATVLLLIAFGAVSLATAEERSMPPAEMPGDLSGVHDFDFEFGEWRVRHRIKRPIPDGQWSEFEGHCSTRP